MIGQSITTDTPSAWVTILNQSQLLLHFKQTYRQDIYPEMPNYDDMTSMETAELIDTLTWNHTYNGYIVNISTENIEDLGIKLNKWNA